MNVRFLQSGKALSAALFVLLLVAVGSKNALAQQTQIATLQRGDSIVGAYYGEESFISAYNASIDGDIITLSSGKFMATDIYKSIIVRGAGCVFDTTTNVSPTIIQGTYVKLDSNTSGSSTGSSFEGIRFAGITGSGVDSITFTKCNIGTVNVAAAATDCENWRFINCIIKNIPVTGGNQNIPFANMSIINSVVRLIHVNDNQYKPYTIYNSVISFIPDYGSLPIKNIEAYNCIFATSSFTTSDCKFFNCIEIKTGETSLFEGQENNTNMTVNGYADVFETFDGTISYDNIYQLKDEIATSFLGNNGTEVGIYGGMMPYTTRLSYMKIKRCNVAPQSTVDGKLSVDIEVLSE